ncbi:MAG TPA: MlaE family lipid ABC transporter permease subunit [Rhodanobacteraceae bacterium]|nr:MlaE family lipid ABC transporter permease subunit [Rhodanobacteraceae bacterium]
MSAGDIQLIDGPDAAPVIHIRGDWTLAHYLALDAQVDALAPALDGTCTVDFSALGTLDTAGAGLLAELLGNQRLCSAAETATSLSPERRALLSLVGGAMEASCRQPRQPPPSGLVAMLERVGRAVERVRYESFALIGFIGLSLETLARVLPRPRRWRITSLFHHMEESGLDAIPIVVLLSFMVGAVIAFLGATVLASYGATLYTVDLVAFAFLREFGVLLASILLAGRTASAFTAQIGSMQAREEIDAIRTLGLDPIELLVLPRTLALVLTLPMLTFLATIAGVVGGAVVCIFSLDITPAMFLTEFQASAGIRHFLIGLSKAPIFAFMIAMIGCLEGFQASGSAESVGKQTTSSVVQSIFVVILFDALAALFFMEMGW